MTEDRGCKVDLLIDEFDLDAYESQFDSLDDHMVARWLGDGRPSEGYRPIATWLNKRILRRTYERVGRETTGTRINSEYDALISDDELLRQEVMDDLETSGVDAEALISKFVSWGTVRNHLKQCVGVEKPPRTAETDWEMDSVERSTEIVQEKAERALVSLSNKGDLPGGDSADVTIHVLLSCPQCPTRIPFADAVDRGFVCADHFEKSTAEYK